MSSYHKIKVIVAVVTHVGILTSHTATCKRHVCLTVELLHLLITRSMKNMHPSGAFSGLLLDCYMRLICRPHVNY